MQNWANPSNLRQGGGYQGVISRLAIIFVCFAILLVISSFIGLYASEYFEKGTRWYYLTQNISQCILGFIGASVASAYLMSYEPWKFTGMAFPGGKWPYAGIIVVYMVSIPAIEQLVWYNEHLHLPESLANVESWMRNLEDASANLTAVILNDTTVWGLLSGILIIGILTGLAEELLFRGVLQRTLATFPPLKHLGIWTTAFIFSAVHLQFFGFFPRFIMGLFFGYLLYWTGSLWPSVFAHALNNSIVVVTKWLECRGVTFEWGVTPSGFPKEAFISLILTVIVFILYTNKFFKIKSK
ncbi:MAG: CPBP family intramembrane metalloprotease [Muribaculaceae bacterium]|nr:CPBP family intramembrane metalloprotease [Muribaculaceae bacterium]